MKTEGHRFVREDPAAESREKKRGARTHSPFFCPAFLSCLRASSLKKLPEKVQGARSRLANSIFFPPDRVEQKDKRPCDGLYRACSSSAFPSLRNLDESSWEVITIMRPVDIFIGKEEWTQAQNIYEYSVYVLNFNLEQCIIT